MKNNFWAIVNEPVVGCVAYDEQQRHVKRQDVEETVKVAHRPWQEFAT